MYGVRVNGVSYKTDYEYPITYTLDKSLDFGSIVIPFSQEQKAFPMYSVVEITRDNDEIEYFLVSGDIVKIASYKPLLYSHTLQLVEYTKKLENYLLPSCTFTQPTDGSVRYDYYDVIERLIKISIFETAANETAKLPCVLDSSMNVLQDIEAPEFFFHNRTLREALDEVLNTLPGIARLKRINGVDTLFVDYLDATSSVINHDESHSYQGEQNVSNYATTMVSDISNAVRGRQGVESVTIVPNSESWLPLSTPGGIGVIDDSRSVMNLKQGIYDIVELKVRVQVDLRVDRTQGTSPITVNRILDEVDLTKFVVTKEQYDALPGSWASAPRRGLAGIADPYLNLPPDITQQEMIEQGHLCKQNAIWFEVGTPFIQGLTTNWQSTFATAETERRRSLENAILTAMDKEDIYNNDPDVSIANIYRVEIGDDATQKRFEMCLFRATFIPQERNNRVQVERDDITNFNKEAMSYFKQNANLINLNAYVNKMNADLQRVGEEQYTVEVIVSSFANLLQLGDITDDGYVLVSRTVIQNEDFLQVTYSFSKNYQQINEMIAVDKSNDYFELVGRDKVLDRFVTYKDYVIISPTTIPNFTPTPTLLTNFGKTTYYRTFDTTLPQPENMAESSIIIRPDGEKLLISLNGSGTGRNLIMTTVLQHNAIAGYSVVEDNDTGGFVQVPEFYAPDGLLETFDLEIFDEFTDYDETFAESIERGRKLPVVDRTDYNVLISNLGTGLGSFKLYKDPGERLNINYQLQTLVDGDYTDKIIVGNYFSNFNLLVHAIKEPFYITYSDSEYGKGETEQVKNGFTEFLDATMISDVLQINNTMPSSESYAIGDSSGRLILAVNRINNVLPTSLRFTFSHTRPGLQKL